MQKKDSLQKMLSFRRNKEKQRRMKIISSSSPPEMQECSKHPLPDGPETAPVSPVRRETGSKPRSFKLPSARRETVPIVSPVRREKVPIDPPELVVSPRVSRTNTGISMPPAQQDGVAPIDSSARVPRSKPQISRPPAKPQQDAEEKEAGRIFMAAAALDCAGNVLCEQGEYDSAMTSYTRALELKQQSLKSDDSDGLLVSVATSINNIGYLRQRCGASAEESMAAYRDSLKIKREILGETHLSVGKTLNNIGSVYYSCRDFENALKAYHEAKDIMERILGTTHGDVATVHSNIGDVYMAQGETEKAHDQYKEALNIRWMRFDEHDPKVIRLLEKIAAIEMDQSLICDDEDEVDETRVFEEEEEVPEQLHNLSCEVEADIKDITDLQRKMALDMVKDKLLILKGMRNINIENNTMEEASSTRSCKTPLSHSERSEALSSVKERLARLRERKAMGELSEANRADDQEFQYRSLKRNMGDMFDT